MPRTLGGAWDKKSPRYVGNNTRSRGLASSIERPLVSQMLGMNASEQPRRYTFFVEHMAFYTQKSILESDF